MTKKHGKHYFHSDGNGGFNVSKSITLGTVIVIMVLLAQFAYSFGISNNKIETLEDDMVINNQEHTEIKDTMIAQTTDVAVVKEKIHNIDGNIEEIKKMLQSVE